MLAETLIKLLVMSIAMVGLVRLVVIVFIGDAQNDLTVWRFMRPGNRGRSRDIEGLSRR
jgi:hypothetical protein